MNCARFYKYTLIFRSKTSAALYVNPQNTGRMMVIKVYMNLNLFAWVCAVYSLYCTVPYVQCTWSIYVISSNRAHLHFSRRPAAHCLWGGCGPWLLSRDIILSSGPRLSFSLGGSGWLGTVLGTVWSLYVLTLLSGGCPGVNNASHNFPQFWLHLKLKHYKIAYFFHLDLYYSNLFLNISINIHPCLCRSQLGCLPSVYHSLFMYTRNFANCIS